VVGRFSDNDGNGLVSLAKWQSLGYDVHSVVSTPAALFVDPVHFNYQLKSGSPAVDAGVTLTDVPTDILGCKETAGCLRYWVLPTAARHTDSRVSV